MRPDATEAGGTPARTSMPYWTAVAAAAPPGTMRPNAAPASWDVRTGSRELHRRAIRCSSTRQKTLPACRTAIATNQRRRIDATSGADPRTLTSVGKTR